MLMNKVQTAVDSLMSSESTDVTTRAALLDGLRADLRTFGSDMLEHLEHEEHAYATPIARKVRRSPYAHAPRFFVGNLVNKCLTVC